MNLEYIFNMELQEVKNDIAKITYNPGKNHLLPFDFILIEDSNQKLIAQVIETETTRSASDNSAILRLSLAIDNDDNLFYYNGYIPSKLSKVIYINPDEITELLKGTRENLFIGALANYPDCFVKPSMSFLKDRLYIQSDREDRTRTIIKNLILQLQSKNKKVILIDFDGSYSSFFNFPKLEISKNFKLPLNDEAFDTILETDTSDCPIEDKAVIESIFLELREYLKTLENNFIPFTIFKNAVDNVFMANPVSGLLLLRNKLWYYAQEGIFAESRIQYDIINSSLLESNAVIIDSSSINEKWYKFVIQTVAELTNSQSYAIFSLNDIQTDKKSIINLFNNKIITPVISSAYDCKYRQLLKSLCKNHILFKPENNINEAPYSVLLNRINENEFIFYGETTMYLPLLLDCSVFNEKTNDEVIDNEIKKDVDKLFSVSPPVIPKTFEAMTHARSNNSYICDDGFNEQDFEFLDELDSDEQINSVKKDSKKIETSGYAVFSPVSDKQIIEKDTVNIPDNSDNIINDKSAGNISSEQNKEIIKDADDSNDINTVPEEKADSSGFFDNDEISTVIENKSDSIENMFFNDEMKDADNDEVSVINAGNGSFDQNEKLQSGLNENQLEDISIDLTENDNGIIINSIESDNIQEEEIIENDNKNELETETVKDDDILNTVITSGTENKDIICEANENSDKNELKTEIIRNDSIDDKDYSILQTTLEEGNDIENIESDENEDLSSNEEEKNNQATLIDELVSSIEDNVSNNESKQTDVQTNDINEETADAEAQNENKAEDLPVQINIRKAPVLTVYETDNSAKISEKDMQFKIGDKVYHPKHGTGIVEGFANYSNKILFCQIEFENVGRRILDPRVSGLKKIS